MINLLPKFLRKYGLLVFLLILISPNIVLVGIRLFQGDFYLAVKSGFYLLVTLLFILIPVSLFPSINLRIYLLLLTPYLLSVPLLIFGILLYFQWPSKSVIYVLLSANNNEFSEFIKGMFLLKSILVLYVILILTYILFYAPDRLIYTRIKRYSVIGILVFLFLSFGAFKSIRNNTFNFFSKTTIKRFVKETPVSVVNRIVKSVQLKRTIRNSVDNKPFDLKPVRNNTENLKEIYVLVIGESSRYDHWHLNGYFRQNSPNMDTISGLVSFCNVHSSYAFTNYCVPSMITSQENPANVALDTIPSLVDFFNLAGFSTCWISNQSNQFNFIGSMARRADRYITQECKYGFCFDEILLDELDNLLKTDTKKLFIVVHQIGSHYPYNRRYPSDFRQFQPDLKTNKHIIFSERSRKMLLNSYDNSILYTDYILGRIIHMVKEKECLSAVLYCSDHGEILFDSDNQSFGRGRKSNSEGVTHVPMFVWLSEYYIQSFPEKSERMRRNKDLNIFSSNLFESFLDMALFELDSSSGSKSFFSDCYDTSTQGN